MEIARRSEKNVESQLTSLVESSADDKESAVAEANGVSALARDELVRSSQAQKVETKGRIETLVKGINRLQVYITSTVGQSLKSLKLTMVPQTCCLTMVYPRALLMTALTLLFRLLLFVLPCPLRLKRQLFLPWYLPFASTSLPAMGVSAVAVVLKELRTIFVVDRLLSSLHWSSIFEM